MAYWTGERLETHITNITSIEHLHRYSIACDLVHGLEVLDLASGEGYGSNLLAKKAKFVTGVDIDTETINRSVSKYVSANLEFKIGSATNVPLANNSVDAVISFETLEHHDKHEEMLLEIKRVLRPNGFLLMSSPDKKFYSDEANYSNPFHVKELYQPQFKSLIDSHFIERQYFNQRPVSGSLILSDALTQGMSLYSGDYEQIAEKKPFTPIYNMVLASDSSLPIISSSIFSSTDLITSVRSEMATLYTSSLTWKLGRALIKPFDVLKRAIKF
jgi:ubiquinone/menaquinone biosynthesis C-methylase UbiE